MCLVINDPREEVRSVYCSTIGLLSYLGEMSDKGSLIRRPRGITNMFPEWYDLTYLFCIKAIKIFYFSIHVNWIDVQLNQHKRDCLYLQHSETQETE